MELIYISGPYRANENGGVFENIQRASLKAKELWKHGYAVLCPHLNTAHFENVLTIEQLLEGDLEMLSRCDLIYMLKGWEESAGAVMEHALAKDMGMVIIYDRT